MKSTRFHQKKEKAVPVVVDECSRLTVQSTNSPVTVYQVDDQGKKVGILDVINGIKKIKLHNAEQIIMESDGDFQSILEGPDPMDTTPLVVPVEKPLTSVQMVRAFYQNENNVRALRDMADAEMTWEDFKDLGDMTDGSDFFNEIGAPPTRYEMQAEQLAAAKESDLSKMKEARKKELAKKQAEYDKALEAALKEKGYVRADTQGGTGKTNQGDVNSLGNTGTGSSHDGGK